MKKLGAIPQFDGTYTIQQKSSGRYLDAYETKVDGRPGFEAVTRPRQTGAGKKSQEWKIVKKDGEVYEIQQESNGQCLDAYQAGNPDPAKWLWNYPAVTRS